MTSSSSSITLQLPRSSNQTVQIGVKCPKTGAENIFAVQSTESVGHLRRHALLRSDLNIEEYLNFGLFLPPYKNKNGKFLEDERPISDYPVLLQGGNRRTRTIDDTTASTSTSTTILNNGIQASPDSGVGQEPCWLELIFKARFDVDDSLHQTRLRKLKTKVTQKNFMDMVKSRDVKGVEKLLSRGFDPNFRGRKEEEAPITLAATIFNPRDLIIALVNGGAHIDFRARDSHTALHRAAVCGNYEAIKTLLDLGQNPNCRDWQNLTPLYHAVSTDVSARCTHALLYDHAILGVEDANGFQEIHQTCKANRPQHLENLIAYGADLNARTRRGQTPLHLCIRYEADACLRQLLLRGADTSQVNGDNQTPLEYALLTNRNEQAKILQTFNPNDAVAISEPPSYNTLRRPTVNGPRGAVAYTMLHRPQASCLSADNSSRCPSVLSCSESLFSADRASSTGTNANGLMASPTAGPNAELTSHRHTNGYAKPWQEVGGTSKTKKFNHYEGPERKISAPNQTTSSPYERSEEKSYTRTVAMRKGRYGFGFTLNGIPRSALLRCNQRTLPSTPSNQYFSSVIPKGPADYAGVREGDFVIEIDGQDVTTACHEDVVECIKNCHDSLIMRVTTIFKSSSMQMLNGRHSESPRIQQAQSARQQYHFVGESSSSSDSEAAPRTYSNSNPVSTKTQRTSVGKERIRPVPIALEERSRSNERRRRTNPAMRTRSSGFRNEVLHLEAISPAAHSGERVFVFEEIDGKTRAVPLEESRMLKGDSRSRNATRSNGNPKTSLLMEKRRSRSLSSDLDGIRLLPNKPTLIGEGSSIDGGSDSKGSSGRSNKTLAVSFANEDTFLDSFRKTNGQRIPSSPSVSSLRCEADDDEDNTTWQPSDENRRILQNGF